MVDGAGRKATSSNNRREMPPSVVVLRWIARDYLAIFKRFRIVNGDMIPGSGPVIFVANHTTSYDPVCLQVACKHRLIRFMQAREYYEQKPLNYLYRLLQVIPVNRTGNDTASIRTALRTLADKRCLGMFPEGKMSEDGQLHEFHKGVALMALMANAPVVPAYLYGTRPFRGIARDYFQFNRVTLYFGPPIRFDDLAGRHRDQDALDLALQRIKDGILALHDRYATG
jgi:1-acyl-sn-glycerol-3-phosphate acyltransferase